MSTLQAWGSKHTYQWHSSITAITTRCDPSVLQYIRNHGEQEGAGLARACLCARHEVTTRTYDGKSVLLNGSGLRVLGPSNVFNTALVEVGFFEC